MGQPSMSDEDQYQVNFLPSFPELEKTRHTVRQYYRMSVLHPDSVIFSRGLTPQIFNLKELFLVQKRLFRHI